MLGTSGLQVSRIGLGAMNFGNRISKEKSFEILDKALELGINFIDTANAYGDSEKIIGEWMKQTKTRDEFIISTKVGWPVGKGINDQGLSRVHIKDQVSKSIKRLNCKYLDIYQPHSFNSEVSMYNLAETLTDLKDTGKVNMLGAPVFTKSWRLVEWEAISKENGFSRLDFKQIPFSPISRSMSKDDTIEICNHLSLPISTFGCLGGGLLTGKYDSRIPFPENGKKDFMKYVKEKRLDPFNDLLTDIAKNHSLSNSEIVVSWVNHQTFISSIILGASQPEQLEKFASSLEVKLEENELSSIQELSDSNYLW